MILLTVPLWAIWQIVRLAFHAAAWLARRPKTLAALTGLGLLVWLTYPLLTALSTAGGSMLPLYLVGGLGIAAAGSLIGYGILEQRGFDRRNDAERAHDTHDDAAPIPASSGWWDE